MVDLSGPPIKIECMDQDSQTNMDPFGTSFIKFKEEDESLINYYQRLEKQNIVSLKNQIL